MTERLNAYIKSTSLGYEDGGIFSFRLCLDIQDGCGCCVGGYAMDDYAQKEAVNELRCCANCKNLSYDSTCKKNKSPINDLRNGNGCGQWQSWEEQNGV